MIIGNGLYLADQFRSQPRILLHLYVGLRKTVKRVPFPVIQIFITILQFGAEIPQSLQKRRSILTTPVIGFSD